MLCSGIMFAILPHARRFNAWAGCSMYDTL